MEAHPDDLEELYVVEVLLELLDEGIVEVEVHLVLCLLVIEEFQYEVGKMVPESESYWEYFFE